MSGLRRRLWAWLPALAAGTALVILLAPTIGSTSISLGRAFDRSVPWADNTDAQIFFVARLPRVLAAALVGATLAASGVVLQALLRNPLATPFTLGVSAGAALGAMLALATGLDVGVLGVTSVPLASFTGSLVATGIVYSLARSQRRGLSTNVLLLAGVTLNSFFSALILFVQFVADFTQAFRTLRWLMGDLDVGSYAPIVAVVPLIAVALGAFAALARPLNLLSVGSDAAAARGVDVARAERLAFFSASLATGAAVSLAGPIGFIGIVVPHIVRLLVGADHRLVLPASVFLGAAFLVACDVVSRTVLSPLELPVGIVTAMIGGPFFLWQLVRHS
jgi:iron complex transport system permease protein